MTAWRWRWGWEVRERGCSEEGREQRGSPILGQYKFAGNHDPNIRWPTTWRLITHLLPRGIAYFKGEYGNCSSLALPFVESPVFLSRALWLAIGCFSNNQCFTSDLMINLVHDSSNLSIWTLKLPLHKYQTIPSIDTSNKHNFGCISTISALGLWRCPFQRLRVEQKLEIRYWQPTDPEIESHYRGIFN